LTSEYHSPSLCHNPTTVKDLKRILANMSLSGLLVLLVPIFHPEKCQCSAVPKSLCVLSPATQGWVHGTLPSPWRTDGPTKLRNLESQVAKQWHCD
jgi:hypothetical protein